MSCTGTNFFAGGMNLKNVALQNNSFLGMLPLIKVRVIGINKLLHFQCNLKKDGYETRQFLFI
jgi:hypothetical protein